jgi:hypothetical protein
VWLFFGGAVLVLLGVGVVATGPAAAGSARSAGFRATGRGLSPQVSVAGNYNAFEYNAVTPNASVTPDAMTINSTGTWSQTLGNGGATDSGGWVTQGTSVALVVSSSNGGDQGCVFLGKVGAAGINKKKPTSKRGPDNCNGVAGSWYATAASTSDAPSPAGPRSGTAPGATRRAGPSVVSAAGSYNLFLNNETAGTLTINSGDTLSLSSSSFGGGDTGYWVSQGKSVALVLTAGANPDCELLGTLKAKGINAPNTKKQHEGPVGCGEGFETDWYATKIS